MVDIKFPWSHSYTTRNVAVIALSQRMAWADAQPPERLLWPNGPTAHQYIQGFIRKPGMGSYVTQGGHVMEELAQLADFLWSLEWKEVQPPDPKPGNKYYQASLPDDSVWQGFQEAVLLEDMPEDKLASVRVRKGPHGLELHCPGGAGKRTNTITAIIDGDGLVTWYPGDITPPINVAKATVKLG